MLSSGAFVRLAAGLGAQDVGDTYQRSGLGPLWTTIGLAIQVLSIGLVFGFLFGADLTTYFPFLVISLVLWNLVTSSLTEASNVYISAERLIRQIEIPFFFPLGRLMSKNVITLFHNFVIVALVMVFYPQEWTAEVLLAVVGILLLVANLYWVVTLVAVAGSRFRDLGPIIASLLTVSFYVTPIIWMPSSLPTKLAEVLLPYNPFFHLMEIVRGPLMGYSVGVESWITAGTLVLVGNLLAWLVARRYWWQVVYWL